MPKWDYKNEPCIICKTKIKDKDIFPYCNKCKSVIFPIEFIDSPELLKKANILSEAYNKDAITNECFIIKRDRLLLLQQRVKDKYLTKLKKEVDKI
jgi:hypothetical protein